MKVYFSGYAPTFNLYTFTESLSFFCVQERHRNVIMCKLEDTWFDNVCSWLGGLIKNRIEYIKIDDSDVFSMDYTLAKIILPMLYKLRDKKCGSPLIDDDDVPDELKSVNAPPKENDWDTDDNWFKRWDYVLDQEILAFEHMVSDDCWKYMEGDIEYNQIQNGLRLFGKYYRSHWW